MKKFILIDHSIIDNGGHHLEYALRVLCSAKELGYKTILSTNKKCSKINQDKIDIIENAFTRSFWENCNNEDIKIIKFNHLNILFNKIFIILNKLISSSIFYTLLISDEFRLKETFKRYNSLSSSKKISFITIITGYFLNRIKKIFQRILKINIFKKINKNFLGKIIIILIKFIIGIIFFPVFLAYFFLTWFVFLNMEDRYSRKFAQELRSLLEKLRIEDNDIIFIPTLGRVELVGVAMYLRKSLPKNILWRFLFRRNIFSGREPGYLIQYNNQNKNIDSFYFFKIESNGIDSRFYTDTKGLSDQYNSLGILKFETLPIPVDNPFFSNKKIFNTKNEKFNILYLGDARDEKGFPLLPRLVSDIRTAGYDKEKLSFTFQSNFNTQNGEPGSRIAKAELLENPDFGGSLIEGPFDSLKYNELINQADIILIPYDSENYYVRSSGIFAEALSAGVPFVSSDKSWMSQEMLEINQKYYKNLLSNFNVNKSIIINTNKNYAKIEPQLIKEDEYIWILFEVHPFYKMAGSYLNIIWQNEPFIIFKADKNNFFYSQLTIDLRGDQCFGLLRLPKSEKIIIEFLFDEGTGMLKPLNSVKSNRLEIRAHQLSLPEGTTLYKGGSFFVREQDFLTATLEILENILQYKKDASIISKSWNSFHNSKILVEMMIEGSK